MAVFWWSPGPSDLAFLWVSATSPESTLLLSIRVLSFSYPPLPLFLPFFLFLPSPLPPLPAPRPPHSPYSSGTKHESLLARNNWGVRRRSGWQPCIAGWCCMAFRWGTSCPGSDLSSLANFLPGWRSYHCTCPPCSLPLLVGWPCPSVDSSPPEGFDG